MVIRFLYLPRKEVVMQKEHQLEIGNEVVIDGRTYWIARVDGYNLHLMRDPDNVYARKRKASSGFWTIFFCILLIAVILKLLF